MTYDKIETDGAIKALVWPRILTREEAEDHLASSMYLAIWFAAYNLFYAYLSEVYRLERIAFVAVCLTLAYFIHRKYYSLTLILILFGLIELASRVYLTIEKDVVALRGIGFFIGLYSLVLFRSYCLRFKILKKQAQNISNKPRVSPVEVEQGILNVQRDIEKKTASEKFNNLNWSPNFVFGTVGAIIAGLLIFGETLHPVEGEQNSSEISFNDLVPKSKGSKYKKTFIRLETFDEKLNGGEFSAVAINSLAATISTVQLSYKPVNPNTDCDHPTKAAIAFAQKRLKDLGFDAGSVDGLLGKQTLKAIKAFQASKDSLTSSGKLDATTLEALEIKKDVGWESINSDTYIAPLDTNTVYFKVDVQPGLSICYKTYAISFGE